MIAKRYLLISLFLIISVQLRSMNIELKQNIIYNSTDINIKAKEYKISNDSFVLKYIDGESIVDDYKIKPQLYMLGTKYYEASYFKLDLKSEEFNYDDEKIIFQENKFDFLQHKFIVPFQDYKFVFNYGMSRDYDYLFNSDIGDLEISNLKLNNLGYEVKKGSFGIGYDSYDVKSNFILNDTTEIGNLNGKWNSYYLSYENFKLSYRDITFDSELTIDPDSAFFISALSDEFIYGDISLDIQNYDLEYRYTKKFKNSKFKIKNNFGVIIDNNSELLLTREIYEIGFNILLFQIRRKVGEVHQGYELEESKIFYNLLNLNYERSFGNLTLGVEKIIPIVFNFDYSEIDVDTREEDEEVDETLNDENREKEREFSLAKVDWEEVILSGLSVYVRYTF